MSSEPGRCWEIYEAILEIKYSCFGVEILVRTFEYENKP